MFLFTFQLLHNICTISQLKQPVDHDIHGKESLDKSRPGGFLVPRLASNGRYRHHRLPVANGSRHTTGTSAKWPFGEIMNNVVEFQLRSYVHTAYLTRSVSAPLNAGTAVRGLQLQYCH